MGLVILCLMVVSFLLSLGLTAVVRRVALKVGFVDRPGHRKIHYIPKPLGGGAAVCTFRRAAGNGLDRRPGYSHNQNSDYHHVESPGRSLAGHQASDAA